jgi:hypothetical protein
MMILPPYTAKQALWLLDGQAPKIADLRMDATPLLDDSNDNNTNELLLECPNTVYEGCFGSLVGNIYNVSGILCWANLVKT